MALTALTVAFLAFVSEVVPEHCPAGIRKWTPNSTFANLYAPFDCPKPDDPSENIYCCGMLSFRFCCPKKCGDYDFSCPRPDPPLIWPDNTDSGTYDSGDYYDSDSDDSGISTGGRAILVAVFLAVTCGVVICCRGAYNREEELNRAMTSDGYVTTYVDGTTLSSPGRVRGRTQASAADGTVIHPTVHVHPRSSDQHSDRARADPPSAPPTQNFYPPDPPPFAPPPSAPPFAPPPSAPPSVPPPFAPAPPYPPGPAAPSAPFSDEPPPYDVATSFPTVNPQDP
ncbi:uncharacterized protein LOC144913590 isoform X2 [Branchiostoma floridae x Branchiostoma belcheri]